MVKVTVKDDQRSSPPSSLTPDPKNVRTSGVQTTGAAWTAFVESIKRQGILQPLVVRPDGLIVAGHRRHAAALELGLDEVPIVVRDIADEDLAAARVIENLHREDLDPIDESDAFALMKKQGLTADEIALRACASLSTVRRRLQLQLLPKKVKGLLRAGEISTTLGIAIARIPTPAGRKEAIAYATTKVEWSGERPTESECMRHIRHHLMTTIANAPFDTEDEDLVAKAPACSRCPNNSACDGTLFPELTADDDAVCSDVACFNGKKEAHVDRAANALREKGVDVLFNDDPDAKSPFDYHGRLAWNAPWIEASTAPGGQPKKGKRQLRTLIPDVPITGLVDRESGTVLEVMPKTKAKKELEAKYAWARKAVDQGTLGVGQTGATAGQKEQQAAARRQAKVEQFTLSRLAEDVQGLGKLSGEANALLLKTLLLEAMSDDLARVIIRTLELEMPKEAHRVSWIADWIKNRPTEKLTWQFALFAMIAARLHRPRWNEDEDARIVEQLAEAAGLDVEEAKKIAVADVQVEEDLKAERKQKAEERKKAKAGKEKK